MSRLAPVFIYGEDERYETIRVDINEVIGGVYNSLPGQANILHISKQFDELMYQLLQALIEFGYEQLDEVYANQSLPFEAAIPTIYRDSYEYRVLDALFYWED